MAAAVCKFQSSVLKLVVTRFCGRFSLQSARNMSGGRKIEGSFPDGVWPTMITPFLDDAKKSVDWKALDMLTEWYIRSGVAGIFSICLSSEMFHITNEERVAIARRVVDKAAGRVPVVAGATFEGSLDDQADLMNTMGKYVAGVVMITNQIATMEESDDVWIANAQKLLDATGDIPVGLYETPYPQVRSLTPSMIEWAAKTGRFVFHKDTSLSVDMMLKKLKVAQSVPNTHLKFFTAKVQFLKPLLDNGGNGFSGVTPNFYPWMIVWMCNSQGQSEEKRERMQRFLSVTDRVIAHKYPTSSKFYLNRFYNAPIQPVSRMIDAQLNDQDELALGGMKSMMEELAGSLDIAIVDPTSLVL